jgi:hypothetical protein
MDEQNASEPRFARYVSPTAPKSGHHLATVSFERKGEMTICWVIEGSQNDEVSAMGMATNFVDTRLWSFSFNGSLIERLNHVFLSPYAHGMKLRFTNRENGPSPLPVQEATAEFSHVRAANRVNPDSAVVAYQLGNAEDKEKVLAAVTGYQRGWFFLILIVIGGLLISREVDPRRVEGQPIPVDVEVVHGGEGAPIRVEGTVAFRASIIGR